MARRDPPPTNSGSLKYLESKGFKITRSPLRPQDPGRRGLAGRPARDPPPRVASGRDRRKESGQKES